ncbi:MAG: fibronectin type III domain-containing protein [Prosthecobacter sp.]
MAKPKLELQKKTDDTFQNFVDAVLAAMTGNANFPTPMPALADITTQHTAFKDALAAQKAAKIALTQATAAKDAARDAVETLVTHLANYVEIASSGEEAKILSAGMQVRTPAAPVGAVAAPGDLAASAGDNEGEVELTCDPVAGASSYEWQCRQHQDGTEWQAVKMSTNSRITVTDLTPGALYAFRVRALGAAGPGPWSDEAVKRAP